MGKKWDTIANFQEWNTKWAKECLRILKPGGFLLAFSGTRTGHRLACGIEDAGFTCKDTIMCHGIISWVYGSGFPKATDISKQLDKMAGKEREVIKEKKTIESNLFEAEKEVEKSKKLEQPASSIYSQGQNKLSKDISITAPATPEAKEWEGWKSCGLKPSYEPIYIFQKPIEKGLNISQNVLKHGTGAINVDGSRIGLTDDEPNNRGNRGLGRSSGGHKTAYIGGEKEKQLKEYQQHNGRFPSNSVFLHHPECKQIGVKKVKGGSESGYNFEESNQDNPTKITKNIKSGIHYGKETVPNFQCHPSCLISKLDKDSGELKSGSHIKGSPNGSNAAFGKELNRINDYDIQGDQGTASRFFKQFTYDIPTLKYCAKSSKAEKNKGLHNLPDKEIEIGNKQIYERSGSRKAPKINYALRKNTHPTTKPISLLKYLINMFTREDATILDCFMGSGSTGVAAKQLHRNFIGIEKEKEYFEIGKARVENEPDTLF